MLWKLRYLHSFENSYECDKNGRLLENYLDTCNIIKLRHRRVDHRSCTTVARKSGLLTDAALDKMN